MNYTFLKPQFITIFTGVYRKKLTLAIRNCTRYTLRNDWTSVVNNHYADISTNIHYTIIMMYGEHVFHKKYYIQMKSA